MTNLVYEPSKTTHWKNLFPNKTMLLGSHNLDDGEELVAIIKTVGLQPIKNNKGGEEEVPVATFENAPPMVLNITNSTTIASLYGDKTEKWIGKSIQIYAARVKAFGSETMALRVREAIPDTGEDVSKYEASLRDCTTLDELKEAFMAIPKHLKPRLAELKDKRKEELSNV